jgi:hypothetical protein
VPEHVRVYREGHSCGLTKPLHEPVKPDGAHRPATLRNEHIGIGWVFPPQPAQGSHFVAADRMHARHPVLGPVNMHAALVKLDLVPLKIAYL